ncbi:MAG: HD domain-containing protein [Vicinamibacterales bacterium]
MAGRAPDLLTAIPTLDHVLEVHRATLGDDCVGYRHHTYRVVNLCLAQGEDHGPDLVEKFALAAAFHDLGIWTDGTFDYLPPSIRLARAYLSETGRGGWVPEVELTIEMHHKARRYRGPYEALVEPFRCADWVDVTRGVRRCGVPRATCTAILAAWPSAGFHARLGSLFLRRLATHPWSPLPMFRV